MFRYVLRPHSILGTPKRLATAFGARTLRWPTPSRRRPSYVHDFMTIYPDPSALEDFNAYPDEIRNRFTLASEFSRANKPSQRIRLELESIPTPTTFYNNGARVQPRSSAMQLPEVSPVRRNPNQRFIVRPLRHTGGHGWRITENQDDYNHETEYLQELYPKDREYRVICVFGEPLIVLRKKHQGIPQDQPWNHTNGSTFVTIDYTECSLRHTDLYDRLRASPTIQGLHLAGVDVLYQTNPRDYVVCEVNLCPSLQIDTNLRKVVAYANEHQLSL